MMSLPPFGRGTQPLLHCRRTAGKISVCKCFARKTVVTSVQAIYSIKPATLFKHQIKRTAELV